MVQRFSVGFLSVVVMAFIAWPLLPNRYEATASLILRTTNENGQIDLTQSLRQPLDENAIQSEIDTVSSNAFAKEIIKQLDLSSDPEFRNATGGLIMRIRRLVGDYMPALKTETAPPTEADIIRNVQDHLTVTRDRRSYTVRVGYWSNDAKKASKMANALVNHYLDFQTKQKRIAFESVNDALKSQILELAEREADSTRELQDILSRTGLNDPTVPVSLEHQIDILSTELGRVRAQKAQASALVAVPASGQVVSNIGFALPLSEFGATVLGDADPKSQIVPSAEDIAATRAARTNLARITLEENFIRNEIDTLRAERSKLSIVEPQIDNLKRNIGTIKTQLDSSRSQLLTRLALTDRLKPDAQLLVEAQPPLFAAFPNLLIVTLVTLLAATMSGLALAFPKFRQFAKNPDMPQAVQPEPVTADLAEIRSFRR